MRYGAHCYLFLERWSDDQLHVLDTARELGLQMFELSVGDDVVFTPRLTRERAAGLDLLLGPGRVSLRTISPPATGCSRRIDT